MEETTAKEQKEHNRNVPEKFRSEEELIKYIGGRDYVPSDEDEELEEYLKSLEESEGYDVLPFPPDSFICGGAYPIKDLSKKYEFYEKLAQFAIDENNKNEKTNYELEEVVKVNFEMVAGAIYYFTLWVKDKDGVELKYRKCQAMVFEALGGSLKLYEFREAPQAEVFWRNRVEVVK